jgi:hypothetical protein
MKTLFLIPVALFLLSLHARADDGANIGGGLNTVHHIPIESYAHDISDLKGYDVFEAKMKLLEQAAPSFAKKVREELDQTTWYLIPQTIAVLPRDKTGLHFDTEQDGYQLGREVFFNKDGHDARTLEDAAKAIMHEAIMRVQERKNERAVRQVIVKLFAQNATPKSVGDALALNQFGTYLNAEKAAIIASHNRRLYLDHIGQFAMKPAIEACDKGKSLASIKSLVQFGDDYLDGRHKGRYDEAELAEQGAGLSPERVMGVTSPFLNRNFFASFNSPYSALTERGANGVFTACIINAEQFGKDVCAELMKDSALNAKMDTRENPVFSSEPALRGASFEEITETVRNGAEDGARQVIWHFAEREPAFQNILALTANPAELRKEVGEGTELSKALRPVLNRQSQLNLGDTDYNRKLICSSLRSLADRMTSLSKTEFDNQHAGHFEPSWQTKRAEPPYRQDDKVGDDPVDGWKAD